MSEIREDPNEDYEENLTKMIGNTLLDCRNQVIQTEAGLEVEEISVEELEAMLD